MTKLRAADSVEDCVVQALALLGMARLREVTGRSDSMIKAWSDCDDELRRLPLAAAAQIDEALRHAGHEAIFGPWLARRGGAAAAAQAPGADEAGESPLHAALRVITGAARMLEKTQQALADGVVEPRERLRLLAKIDEMRRRLTSFRRSLFVPVGR